MERGQLIGLKKREGQRETGFRMIIVAEPDAEKAKSIVAATMPPGDDVTLQAFGHVPAETLKAYGLIPGGFSTLRRVGP